MSPRVPTLTFAHSPDADDAFMFYGFHVGAVEVEGARLVQVLAPIEELNRAASEGRFEVTALSVFAWGAVGRRYRVLPVGASMGRGYGPIVVAREPRAPDWLRGRRVAVPGTLTTAYALARLSLPPFEAVPARFDEVGDLVRRGEVDAGVLIHEGQLTFADEGLACVLDLGRRWAEDTALPLPLGVDCVRADVPDALARAVGRALRESIRYARAHEEEALAYALRFGRGVDAARGKRFIAMYVNEDTLDMGAQGRAAVERLLGLAVERGLLTSKPPEDAWL